jgi:hypothetical protein
MPHLVGERVDFVETIDLLSVQRARTLYSDSRRYFNTFRACKLSISLLKRNRLPYVFVKALRTKRLRCAAKDIMSSDTILHNTVEEAKSLSV